MGGITALARPRGIGFGVLILWGTVTGRVPGSRLQSFWISGALAAVGAIMLATQGMSRGPRAAQLASESTRLEIIEGPFRRERLDPTSLGGHTYATKGDARYDYLLFVGTRRIRVSEKSTTRRPKAAPCGCSYCRTATAW